MSTTLKIKVTKKEIMLGKCGKPWSCAIALSIRDIFPEAVVAKRYIHTPLELMPIGNCPIWIPLPLEARSFVSQFDQFENPSDRQALKPFEFYIEIPDEVIEQINIEELRPLLVNHPTLELI